MNPAEPLDPRTARVGLRPVRSDDLATIYGWETDPAVVHTWRLRGNVPAFDDWAAALWNAHCDQRLVVGAHDGRRLGLAQLYNVDLRLQHGWLSIISAPEVRSSGLAFEGCGLFIHRCFTEWPLRRLYFHSIRDNLEGGFASLPGKDSYSVYGVLRDRVVVDGERRDVVVGGIERDRWEPRHGAYVARAIARAMRASGEADAVR